MNNGAASSDKLIAQLGEIAELPEKHKRSSQLLVR
jgi:hypothetical protein